jgi:hypothetical protein
MVPRPSSFPAAVKKLEQVWNILNCSPAAARRLYTIQVKKNVSRCADATPLVGVVLEHVVLLIATEINYSILKAGCRLGTYLKSFSAPLMMKLIYCILFIFNDQPND